jgi:putative ABC transport system permease protein/lipoprotein-releasing system permease protein
MLVIVLAVLLIAGIVSVMNSIPLSVRNVYGYSKHITGATPRGDMSYFPELKEHFEKSPIPIERTIIARTVLFNVRSIVGPWPFVLHGISNADATYLVEKIGLKLTSGRFPEPGQPEAVISERVARNLGLSLGDVLLRPDDEKNYSPFEVKVVGILAGSEWFAFTSYEYLKENHFPPVDVLIFATPNLSEQRKLDAWAEESLRSQRALVFTFPSLERDTEETFRILFKILNVVVALLVTVITLMMAMLINIYLSQRIVEFGLLQAIGFTQSKLIKRAIYEASLVVAIGWLFGVVSACALLSVIRSVLMDPKGFYIDPLDPVAYAYSIPVPIAILAAAAATVWWRFRKFDPISVVERRVA